MLDLTDIGTSLPVSHFPHLRWESDLQAYEGPLLMKYRNGSGECFLMHWCDQNDEASRWLVMRVRERDIFSLLAQRLTMYELITQRLPEPHAFLVDMDNDGEIQQLVLMKIAELPEAYTPDPDSLLIPELIGSGETTGFVGLISGTWTMDEMATMSRKVQGLYSLLYLHEHDLDEYEAPIVFKAAPFQGGFSTVNFYQFIRAAVPRHARPDLAAIQYSSPGFLTFNGDPEIVVLLQMAIDKVRRNYAKLHDLDRALTDYLKNENLNREGAKSSPSQDAVMGRYAESIMRLIENPSFGWILERSHTVFQATKIIRGYYSRLRDLMIMEDSDRCVLAVAASKRC